jgi:uncharacterized repeat protein (TIGR03803 family)
MMYWFLMNRETSPRPRGRTLALRRLIKGAALTATMLLAACGGSTGNSDCSFSISGTVSGLPTGLKLTLLYNGANADAIAANGTFTFTQQVTFGSTYSITVGAQPAGYTCSVTGGSGTVTTTTTTGLTVSCTRTGITLGGTIAGLGDASGLVLTDGVDTLTVAAGQTSFTFPTLLTEGSAYSISVATQPTGMTCTVAGGSGTAGSANIANAVVTCSNQAYTLGGTVSGLTAAGLVLANGSDTVTLAAGATAFTMPTAVAYTSSYAVTVKTQPTGLACSVTHGTGTMPASNVTGVAVTCTAQPFSLGGSITGLGNNTGLVLANGSDTLAVSSGATSFTMPTAVSFGSTYAVTVKTVPAGLTCTVTHGTGTMPASNVTNVVIACADQAYTVGGTITGLSVSGLVLANGSDTLSVAANATSFTMPTAVAYTSTYSVTVQTQPANATCTVSSGSGTMGTSAVTTVAVNCAQSAYTVGGAISGLTANGLVLVNGSDTLDVLANAATFTMPTAVAQGASYDVTVQTNPAALNCAVSNGSGIMANTDVANVSVSCAAGTESFLSSFGAQPDGQYPFWGGLVQGTDGNFYGMTSGGGTNNSGTVFKITPAGVETVLWSFGSGTDGSYPYNESLTLGADGNFYGTTYAGGANNEGTVFKITPSGTETVLWSFGSGADGIYPTSKLTLGSDGNFYGMTYERGAHNAGIIFMITPSGTETVLYSFGATANDAGYPYGNSLIQASDGSFYGMTAYGGASGSGTVFKYTPGVGETVLWTFGSGSDGKNPFGALLQASDGNFYATTSSGGASNQGTVLKITPAGTETVLYSFLGGSGDGSGPQGTLIQANDGVLYGTTVQGGSNSSGTLFSITMGGAESLLWSFGGGQDGRHPYGDLVQGSNGNFYGMTSSGGPSNYGVVFEFN